MNVDHIKHTEYTKTDRLRLGYIQNKKISDEKRELPFPFGNG